MRLTAWVAALSLVVSAAFAQGGSKSQWTEGQKACTAAALTDYNKKSVSLLEREKPLPSVDTQLAIRRLEEEFCLTFIRCVLDDQNALTFRGA